MTARAYQLISSALTVVALTIFILGAVTLLGLGVASPALAQADAPSASSPDSKRIDRTFGAKDHGEIDIRISAGSIRIVGQDRSTAQVVGLLGAEVERFESFVDGRYLRFVAHPPSAPPETPIPLDSELVLYLPQGSDVSLETIEADVEIEGIRGQIQLKNGTGDIAIQGTPRRIDATSVTGDMAVEVSCPDVELKTVSGEVTVAGKIESLIAETVETTLVSRADIEVEGWLSTVTGTIRFEGQAAPTARVRIKSSSGGVHLALDPEITGTFSLNSDRGDLTNAFGPEWSKKAGRLSAEWQRGESPRRFEIETFDGDIRLDILP